MAIEVWTAQDLYNVRNNLYGDYIQMADIDLSGYAEWVAIGTSAAPFKGKYNGNRYRITGLKAVNYNYNGESLFGELDGATITNVIIEGAVIGGVGLLGVLAGYAGHWCTIRDCHVSGTIQSRLLAEWALPGDDSGVGGLVGIMCTGTIERCSSSCTVDASTETSMNVGGLVGWSDDAEIKDSYSLGPVTGGYYVGGLAGGASGVIENCYSAGAVSGMSYVGGLVGYGSSYLLTVTSSYYDLQTSGQSDTGKGEPRTTAEMKQRATFVGWDFVVVWGIDEGLGYPYLSYTPLPFTTDPADGATDVATSKQIRADLVSLDTTTVTPTSVVVTDVTHNRVLAYTWSYGTGSLLLTVTGGLPSGSTITVAFSGLKTTSGRAFESKAVTFTTAVPFTVVATAPANGAVEVPLDQATLITFSDSLNTSTVTSTSVAMYDYDMVNYTVTPIPYTWTYDALSRTLALTAVGGLPPQRTIVVLLSSSLKSTKGTSLNSYSFGFMTASSMPLECEPPTLLTHNITCAHPTIVFRAPTPADPPTGPAKWQLHFKVTLSKDEGGIQIVDSADSTVNPERFEYSIDEGKSWQPFPATGLPPESYGCLVRVPLVVGPRKQVWIKLSVGAEDA